MNALIIFLSIILSKNLDQQVPTLDVSDLITNAMVIGNRDFDKDITDQKYVQKPWRVYNTFIDKGSYYTLLSYDVPGLSLAKEDRICMSSN